MKSISGCSFGDAGGTYCTLNPVARGIPSSSVAGGRCCCGAGCGRGGRTGSSRAGRMLSTSASTCGWSVADCSLGPAPPAPPASPARGSGRSLAEAFLRAGVRAFVGTFYAVDDTSAREFASIVHGRIAGGCALGDAIHAARRALYDGRKPDWGNFLLYGDHAMIL
jgi:hypothetical protein